MNNYILINRTYAETTPESAEIGDFSDQGFIEENKRVTFKELIELMKEHRNASATGNPSVEVDVNISFSTGFYTSNFRTGTDREESMHYSRDNTPNCAKYWKLAAKIAQKARK